MLRSMTDAPHPVLMGEAAAATLFASARHKVLFGEIVHKLTKS
jgi:hypothetical protein